MDLKTHYLTQNELLLKNLLRFYGTYADNTYTPNAHFDTMLSIITGESTISLRITDWFATNYAKKNFTIYSFNGKRFKVYEDYKLKLKAYSKKRFDPFCRYDKISIPYKNGQYIETTIGQLNFFKWAIENRIIDYIDANYAEIENDMNERNSASIRKKIMTQMIESEQPSNTTKTRKKREELSVSAIRCLKKENVETIMSFR